MKIQTKTVEQPKEPENQKILIGKLSVKPERKIEQKKKLQREKQLKKIKRLQLLEQRWKLLSQQNRLSSPTAYQQYYGMNQAYDQPEENEEQKIERKVNELLAKKEEQYRKQQAEEEQKTYPQRLMKDFPDFGQICSQENLDYLDFHYPEISRPLQRLGEGYDKWHDTYHAVKKLIPNHSNARKEAAKAEANNMKPRSMSSSGPSPMGENVKEGWQNTEARRAENWARMQRTIKSTG